MLDRFRKRIEGLFNSADPAEKEASLLQHEAGADTSPSEQGASQELAAAIQARKEARRREARLILSERVHNRAQTLMSEIRNQLLSEIQLRLEEEADSENLQDLLQVALDPAFTARLDVAADEQVNALMRDLETSFQGAANLDSHLPSKEQSLTELKAYRDQILRTHMLEQVEVYALPSLSEAFPSGDVPSDQLRQKNAQYWDACREALDRFFRSVEMALLNGARPGIRLEPSMIRDRLVAAQFRNGYRVLEERFRQLYGKIAEVQMANAGQLEKAKAQLDRRAVDEIIVPLAYFIRDRSEPEPREALKSRSELFREIVDKLIASNDPFVHTAEVIKPLLRRSIEQARPLVLESFPYLRSSIESLKPTEIHRATALLHLFEALVEPDVDEQQLQTVEQSVRLNKWQYHLHLQLWNHCPSQLERLQPLDRIHAQDAQYLAQFIETVDPSPQAIEDMAVRLGYFDFQEILRDGEQKTLLRALCILTLPRAELSSWPFLYDSTPPSEEDLQRMAKAILRQIRTTGAGADDRQQQLGAAPLPVELSKALSLIGYEAEDGGDRVARFRDQLESLIISGEPKALAQAIRLLRRLQEAVDLERLSAGLVGAEGDPYVSEVWLKESGALIGLLFYRGNDFGQVPIEKVSRDPDAENRADATEKLKRQLNSQAIIYQAFHKLFRHEGDLPRARKHALPTYLKTTYERIEPNRHSLLAHLKNARLLLRRIEEFSFFIAESSGEARPDATKVERILSGLSKKVDQLFDQVEKTKNPAQLARFAREYERVVRYVNVVILHSVNPWLERHTRGLTTEFDFIEEEVVDAIRGASAGHGLDWNNDVEDCEAHLIRGTLGCRALLQLVDGSSKVVLLEYDRRRRAWQVKHFGPRIADVVNGELNKHGHRIPDDYDEKFEQPTFRMEEQSCRFLLIKKGSVRIEATLVLDLSNVEKPWRVVYLKWNDDVLADRDNIAS